MHVFYLHGFASGPHSSKAAFLAARLEPYGIVLRTPDLNLPDFATLTITRMIERVCAEIDRLPPAPVVLVGSSLGAFVAIQAALRRPPRVAKLVLLAPALDFGGPRMRSLGGQGIDAWKRTNQLAVFHYGYGRMVNVHYGLYEDARQYDCLGAALPVPVQVFQGRHDTVVDPAGVEAWAASRPDVELHVVDDDHQLGRSLEFIWAGMERFLGLRDPR
jgi:pimeloyl-ACP methyl ester carboxylesterase